MKHRRLLAILSMLALAVLALPAFGQAAMVEPNLYFQNVWARSTASVEAAAEPGAADASAVSAVYMTIANAGGVGVRLVSVESPAAEFVEIHEMRMNGEVMEMRPVEGGLDIHSGGVSVLEPGGFHLMLLNLTEPLVTGQAVPLTLTFLLLDDTGAPTEETLVAELAAPVLDEAPEPAPFAFSLIWARPAEAGTVSAAYMTILNAGDDADTLVSASTDVAGIVEIHEMRMNGDVMEMRPVEGGVPVDAMGMAVLEQGGVHIMLMDLTQALEEGSAFALTLTFESGAEVNVGVPVYDRTTMLMNGM